MIYNTGTIAVNGNTATGTGTNWTAPASQVRAGQTIIVMSNPVQLFQISSVNSATSMTVTPAASPALSGQKYGILVSDNISVDGLAQAMSQLINDYDENIGAWETFATTSANQSITVTINGIPVTIPGIGKLAQKGSNGAIPIAQGGTGATNEEDARTNLGLGISDTVMLAGVTATTGDLNVQSTTGSVRYNAAAGGEHVFNSAAQRALFNCPVALAAGSITIPNTASATAPSGPGIRGIYAGADTANFDNASNINLYSWYGIGFCTAYTSPTNGVQEGKPAVYINTRNGTINAKGAVQANGVTLTSDWNAKEEVNIIEPAEALEKIAALDGYTFRYKNADSKRLTAGALAQDLDLVIPDLVIHDEATDYLVADYMGLIGYLIAALKGLKLQIDEITNGENLNNNKGTNAEGELTEQNGA
ncbi:tail fiber domain-containing protein [Enterobacter mori]|uniref:tail fiber domain-containing protein n=1 Tax=Enterobacter mori TaxID=539813 RepID=UPI0021B0CB1B|nr:tail fiber domain-containing protein [Enterobacter mori]UWX94985.1 tail fiber domain-containing protein [Enterobacter mori]